LPTQHRPAMRKQITFYVNDKAITRPVGTTVEKAILAYSQAVWSDVRHGRALVVDSLGNRIDWDGSMYDGAHVYIRHFEGGDAGIHT
jgi:hypothetical protein